MHQGRRDRRPQISWYFQNIFVYIPHTQKLSQRFEVKNVVLVGYKGMLKRPQIELLDDAGYDYITSITKSQIQPLVNEGTIQMELFEDQ